MPKRDDEAHEIYGALKNGIHIGSYAFERAFRDLQVLLDDENRWRLVGDGFTDINEFLASLNFEKYRILAEQRKQLAQRIKALQPQVSNRSIAKLVGASASAIDRDTRAASNDAPSQKKPNENKGAKGSTAPNGASAISGSRAARLVHNRETGAAERLERVTADEERVLSLVPVKGKFRTLVFDPAWEYDWLSLAGRAKPGYAMQPLDKLREMDIRQWAEDKCHLYVWTTNNFMYEACRLVEHWGFQHRVVITGIKSHFGLGSYFRNATEHVLFATLGDTTTRPAAASISTWFNWPDGLEHSEKPEEFYDIVRKASYPPYGEGNQRKPRPDFTNLFTEVSEQAAE
jgi:N6-adenosine-specific RNA methylase IME4